MMELFFGKRGGNRGDDSPRKNLPGTTRNCHIFSRAYDAENPGPGRPLTVRAAGCAECVHGGTGFGCSRACPYYGTSEMRRTPVLAAVAG